MSISQAYAQTAPATEQVVASGLPEGIKLAVQLLLIFFVLYFMFLRPQQKKLKEHQAQLTAIVKGTKIVVSGIVGTVKSVKDDELTLEVAPNVEIKVLRDYVSQVFLNESSNGSARTVKKNRK